MMFTVDGWVFSPHLKLVVLFRHGFHIMHFLQLWSYFVLCFHFCYLSVQPFWSPLLGVCPMHSVFVIMHLLCSWNLALFYLDLPSRLLNTAVFFTIFVLYWASSCWQLVVSRTGPPIWGISSSRNFSSFFKLLVFTFTTVIVSLVPFHCLFSYPSLQHLSVSNASEKAFSS